ncbi:MAG: AI-2E family transporter [Proteobacteria bacterium]|nr:AI-2E family transporter [Pseudomonadota bacterium]
MTSRRWFWLWVSLAFILFLFAIRSILLPFVVGMLVAYFLSPAVDRLERARLPRPLAVLLLLASFFSLITVAVLLAAPVVAAQVSGLIADMPTYIHNFQRQYSPQLHRWLGRLPVEPEQIQSSLNDYSGEALKVVASFVAGLFQSGMAVINAASLVIITPVVAFYLMNDWHSIVARLDALLPRAHAHTTREQVRIIDDTLAGFVRGQVNVCLLMGLYYGIGLTLVGLKFGFLIGFLTGVLVIVPYAGWFFGFATGMAVALFQFPDMHAVIMAAAVFITGMAIEGNYITPKLVGEKVGLHPVWIIFGLLVGAALFGFVGVLLAVPMTAVVGVLIRFATQRYLRSGYYSGEVLPPPLV